MKQWTFWLMADGIKRDIWLLAVSGLSLGASVLGEGLFPLDPVWVAIVLCGVPIIFGAVKGLITSFDIKADVLVSLALVAAVIIGEDFAAGEVAFIMQLGSLLEELTVAKARAGMEKLIRLSPRTARVIAEGKEKEIPADEVKAGDVIRVLPGETIPADGIITKGITSVNQAVMTGESLPVDKEAGDEVYSGTVNQFGSFDMKASRAGEDSSLQRMIRLVRSADAGKAEIVTLADRWATWIVVMALMAAGITWLFTGEIIRAVTILVVFCPCALVLATPTAVMAAIGNATRHGCLIREGDALERLAKVNRCTFDKTGTLTFGTPKVAAVRSFLQGLTPEALYEAVAGAEMRSEHPLGKAVVKGYSTAAGRRPEEPSLFQMLPGRGVKAVVRGKSILAGTEQLLLMEHILISDDIKRAARDCQDKGCTIIFAAVDGKAAGFLALSDTLRLSAAGTICQIRENGVVPVLLTGDQDSAAYHIAEKLAITEVHARCLPEDKLSYIRKSQKQGGAVCMIGDGINDAPALKTASVGIAMGGIGSDIAVEAADIALVRDDIREIPHLFRLSRRMMHTIRCNLTFSMGLNLGAVLLAMTGILDPVTGALTHNAGSVFVIIHSALLLRWKSA